MANLYKNKVVYGNDVLMDITDTTATPDGVVEGQVFYGANGARNVGTLGLVTTTKNGLMAAVDKAKLDGINIYCKTTAELNNDINFIPERGAIVIYLDHNTMIDDVSGEPLVVPDIKIGDGNAYCIDLPFVRDAVCNSILTQLNAHMSNSSIHVTPAEKQFWNQKLNYEIEDDILVLNQN